MIDAPSKPLLDVVKGLTTNSVSLDTAKAIDQIVAYICERAAAQPRRIPNLQADGSMQSVPFSPALAREPSIVYVVVTQPPTIMVGTDRVAAPYTVEYGMHTKDAAQVKVTAPSGATAAKFDLIVCP